MKNLKICNVDEEGRFGGPERRIVQVAVELKKYSVDTCVLYPKRDSDRFTKELDNAGVWSCQLNITRLSKERSILILYILRFFYEVYLMVRFFKKESFDLIHVNGAYQFKAAVAGRLANIPVVWHLNDTYAPKPLKELFTVLYKYVSKGFVVAGRRVYDYYLKDVDVGKKPCIEIHAPVELSEFNPGRFSKKSNMANSKLKIGTISGVNPAKGLEYFVDLVSKIYQERQDLEFFVAGAILSSQKSYNKMLKDRIKSYGLAPDLIKFVGLVDDVPAFLNDLDICVFTSVTEASPTSIWEAMAMGKPVVTTDVGSVNQYVEDGESGFVAPIKDVSTLHKKLVLMCDDEHLRKELGDQARRVAVANLSVESATKKHNEIYRKVVACEHNLECVEI